MKTIAVIAASKLALYTVRGWRGKIRIILTSRCLVLNVLKQLWSFLQQIQDGTTSEFNQDILRLLNRQCVSLPDFSQKTQTDRAAAVSGRALTTR